MSRLPNFVVIGAARCGTTSLYAYLREHPQIFMSPEKETDYFSLGDLPPSEVPDAASTYRARSREEYERLFRGAGRRPSGGRGVADLSLLLEKCRADAAADPGCEADLHPARPHRARLLALRVVAQDGLRTTLRISRLPSLRRTSAGCAIAACASPMCARASTTTVCVEFLARFPRERILVLLFQDFAAEPRRHDAQRLPLPRSRRSIRRRTSPSGTTAPSCRGARSCAKRSAGHAVSAACCRGTCRLAS